MIFSANGGVLSLQIRRLLKDRFFCHVFVISFLSNRGTGVDELWLCYWYGSPRILYMRWRYRNQCLHHTKASERSRPFQWALLALRSSFMLLDYGCWFAYISNLFLSSVDFEKRSTFLFLSVGHGLLVRNFPSTVNLQLVQHQSFGFCMLFESILLFCR